MSLSLIEQSLDLEEIDSTLYRSKSTWTPLGARGVFGGQVVAQALAAAGKTVDPALHVHSLHSYFLLPGDSAVPILYFVDRNRDGKSFATRTVKATQNGKCVFTLQASFHRREEFIVQHQWPMPSAPDPETLQSEREIYNSYQADPRFKKREKAWFKLLSEQPFPIDLRSVRRQDPFNLEKIDPARQLIWMKSNGILGDDPRIHQCVVAYSSDHRLLSTPLLPHGLSFKDGQVSMMASLDHSMWFYEPFRADEWLLYELESPKMSENRGLSFGRIYTKDGKLAVAVAQEGLIRLNKTANL